MLSPIKISISTKDQSYQDIEEEDHLSKINDGQLDDTKLLTNMPEYLVLASI